MSRGLFSACCVLLFSSVIASAHQPVMDMAPRWEEGYGFQIRQEYYGSDKLMEGDSVIDNPLGLKRYVHKTWLEGVYTFDRARRVTFKLPYIYQSRTKNIGDVGVKQSNHGFGDLIVGIPLKHYKNFKAHTSNFGITPSLRIPIGSNRGDFPISDGSLDVGVSISYSAEGYPLKSYPTLEIYQLYDLFYWKNNKGKRGMREGDEIGFDMNIGIHPYHNDVTNTGVFLLWDVTARYHQNPNSANLTSASGGSRIQTGPILVLYKNNLMFRSEYKYPLYEKTRNISNSYGHEFNIGIGITF